ncbi:hypothetical protein JHK82_047092 [Glycine max]|uniref:Uncharacterized protein n=2 Tax=Glycine subgen. Soja TaxID=1462606 RepID=A0A0R0FB18_SOYBN|nr:hypothetical protein JHK86_046983 [Glycine max]KAG4932785.1 hypothetical protein JHK87_046787 [Glycine soja]KAG4942909.1 hypothetical protein JHK85_047555 [Glycine max]KAG5097238.1 hypothetical protein JHK82_047092 [Glycine max]KAG5102025.1 hypothetical protein JHK84_046994 [Glycine max]
MHGRIKWELLEERTYIRTEGPVDKSFFNKFWSTLASYFALLCLSYYLSWCYHGQKIRQTVIYN